MGASIDAFSVRYWVLRSMKSMGNSAAQVTAELIITRSIWPRPSLAPPPRPHEDPRHRRRRLHRQHVAQRLLARGDEVVGLDNLNDYYDVQLKQARLARLDARAVFASCSWTSPTAPAIERAVRRASAFDRVVHLAAQAGVRYSLQNPHAYVDATSSAS